MTDQDRDRAGILSLLKGFRREWVNAVGGVDLRTKDPDKKDRAYDSLSGFASELVIAMRDMVEERERVRNKHPWHFGAILNLLLEIVEEKPNPVSRFEVMQRFGYWHGRRFNEWANEQTGVKEKTWRQWVYVTRTYFETDAGKKLLDEQDLTADDFIEKVPMGKATRAVSKVASGELKEHHVEALVDDMVTEPQLNITLKTTKQQHEQAQVEELARGEKWVADGSEPKTWVQYEEISKCIVVKRIDESGKYHKPVVLAKLYDRTSVAFHGHVQQQMIEAAEACKQGEAPGLFDVVVAEAKEKVEVGSDG